MATPASFGLHGEALAHTLARIAREERFAAFELAEYCPRLDHDGTSERVILRLLRAVLGGAAQDPQVVADALHAA